MTDTTQLPTEDESPPSSPTSEVKSSPIRLGLIVAGILALGLLAGTSMLIVVIAIIVMVFFHELGHFLTAKAAGMKVTEFFIGAGPKLWSFRRGETEYGVKAIPVLAYVRIIGMTNLEEVPPEDEPRTYRQKPFWRRLSVAVAGSTMHFAMAFVCLLVLFAGTGVPGGKVFASYEDLDRWVVGSVEKGSAADKAGVEPGDRLISIDGQLTTTFGDVRDIVQPQAGDTVPVVFERDGETFTVETKLGSHVPEGETERVGLFGIKADFPKVEFGPIEATKRAGQEFGTVVTESMGALVHFFSWDGLSDFAGQIADGGGTEDGPVVGDGDAGGGGGSADDGDGRLISILGASRIGADATDTGLAGLLTFLVLLNVFIGVFNLVPLLPLDGGHVAIATYERIRSRRGRMYHADVAKLLPLTYAVVAVFITIGITSLYLDIVNPLDLSN